MARWTVSIDPDGQVGVDDCRLAPIQNPLGSMPSTRELHPTSSCLRLAASARIPMINARTSFNQPCEILGDIAYVRETRGDLTRADRHIARPRRLPKTLCSSPTYSIGRRAELSGQFANCLRVGKAAVWRPGRLLRPGELRRPTRRKHPTTAWKTQQIHDDVPGHFRRRIGLPSGRGHQREFASQVRQLIAACMTLDADLLLNPLRTRRVCGFPRLYPARDVFARLDLRHA